MNAACMQICKSWINMNDAFMQTNIARIANTVQWHSLLSDNKDCHEFRFSIVRIATRQMPQASRIVFVIIFEKL